MKKLSIQLNQEYKSFKEGFKQEIIGDLVILSGINGSGKSQLIDIIRSDMGKGNARENIKRIISQNGVRLENTEVVYKSFRDYSHISELSESQVGQSINVINSLYQNYTQHNLDPQNHQASGYRESWARAKKILIDKFGSIKFDTKTITLNEFKETIPRDFVLFPDDIFTNKVGEIFFNYVSRVHNEQALAGRNGTKFSLDELPLAPWKQLNSLFSHLNLQYRFKDNFERINDEITEQPVIYALNDAGVLDLSQPRSLKDLSDGEKALISLTFAVIAADHTRPRILLLDEYDATLNPSLTKSFFIVLEEFFIKKDIQVIMVTHSPASLSLAPDYTVFYEVYKPKGDRPRILQVQRDQYDELTVANKKFYEKIENQDARYAEIEAENQSLKDIVSKLQQTNNKVQIISEGKNNEHIEKAISILAPELLNKIEIIKGAESKTGTSQLKNTYEIVSNIVAMPKAIFIWDCDAITTIENLEETPWCKKYCFPYNQENTKMQNGIENLYPDAIFTDDIYTTTTKNISGGVQTTKIADKGKILQKIKSIDDIEVFKGYNELVEKIKKMTE